MQITAETNDKSVLTAPGAHMACGGLIAQVKIDP